MGLDIRVWKNTKLKSDADDGDVGDDEFFVSSDNTTPATLGGERTGIYTGDRAFGFRAGSYSTYNEFRAVLSRLGLGVVPEAVWENPEEFEGQPFIEMINFSDCEGFIGPKTAKKLAADFERFNDKFTDKHDSERWLVEIYRDFAEAFKEAAESDGWVQYT
jgi:hypothetical protein